MKADLPAGRVAKPLRRLATIKSSNVDKVVGEGEQAVRLCNYVDVYYNDHITGDLDFSEGSATPQEIAKFALRENDVVITKDSETPDDIAVPALVEQSAQGVVCGYHLAVLRAHEREVLGPYLFWSLLAKPIKEAFGNAAQGVTRYGLTLNGIGSVSIPLPDIDTQKTIATYLDRETTLIDRLIAKKEQFQKTIDAKRKALTAALVDGSLIHGSNASGVSGWHGRLPSHWKATRARFLFREHIDPSQNGSEELLTVSHITGVTARAEKNVTMFLAETLEGYKLVEPDDLVVNTMWAWMGAIGVSPISGCASPSYAVYRPHKGLFRSDYLDLVVRSLPFVAEVNRRSKGIWASRLRLYPDAFLDIPFPLPPIDEQEQLVDALKASLRREEAIAAKSQRSIVLLKERRAALITASIHDQLDIKAKAPVANIGTDRGRVRLVVGAEIIHMHQGKKKFGRTKWQKELYLAEAHVGISKLQGNYRREAAGPLDRALIEETEAALQAAGYYRTTQPDGAGTPVTYAPLPKAGQHAADLKALLGTRADELKKLVNLLRDLDTEGVEAITTLYAVWNDALIDGKPLDDASVIEGVLTDWHREKGEKFKADDLARWLAWMKRHGLTPHGQGPRTIHTMTRDMFA